MHSFNISERSPIKLVLFINDTLQYTLNQLLLSHPNGNVFKPMQTVTYQLFLTGALIKILSQETQQYTIQNLEHTEKVSTVCS